MSENSIKAKIDFILEMISNIEKIIERHNGIVPALEDFEGQMAILMGIAQIGETLKKFDDEFLKQHNLKDDKDGAYYTRNYIVHNYEGVDFAFIEDILRNHIPKLKEKIEKLKIF
jgi:uncharacterized protein with HEPN domain